MPVGDRGETFYMNQYITFYMLNVYSRLYYTLLYILHIDRCLHYILSFVEYNSASLLFYYLLILPHLYSKPIISFWYSSSYYHINTLWRVWVLKLWKGSFYVPSLLLLTHWTALRVCLPCLNRLTAGFENAAGAYALVYVLDPNLQV